DAATESKHYFLVADLLPNSLASLLDEGAHRPIHRTTADMIDKVLENLFSARCVRHFGMELQSIELSLGVLDRGERRIFSVRGRAKARGHGRDLIAVTAPNIDLLADSSEELRTI